jgi:hypothetical protein
MKIQALLLRLGGVFRVFGLPADKGGHLIAGVLLGLLFGLIFWPVIGLAAACVAAVGKEIRDRLGYGTPDVFDALATMAGGVLAWAGLHYWPSLLSFFL